MKSLAQKVQRFLVSEDGPTAVEYAVMLALIMIQMQSFSRMFLVFATFPLGLIGAVLALLISQQPFGFVALLGVIGATGLAVWRGRLWLTTSASSGGRGAARRRNELQVSPVVEQDLARLWTNGVISEAAALAQESAAKISSKVG